MFRHTAYLQFDVAPEKPDPVYAHKLQELLGGAYGEMTARRRGPLTAPCQQQSREAWCPPGTPGSPPPRASAAPARDPEPAVSRLVGPHPDNNTADVGARPSGRY